jgi:hypothetical protein
VISGSVRHTPAGVVSMPAFGSSPFDTEIAAVSNYVTARFGSARSSLTDKGSRRSSALNQHVSEPTARVARAAWWRSTAPWDC